MHTQGKWEVESNVVVACDGRLSICEVHDHSDTSEQHDAVEAEDNARLIAAAPAMLEACRGLLAHLWDDRKRNVKRDFSLMVAEVAAQKAIALTTDKERE